MARLVALLGSINIGGNRVKMVDLKAAFAEEGFKELVTVAASGNLILSDERDPVYIEKQLERVLADRFKFSSCVMVRTKEQVQAAVDDNPFHGAEPEHGSDKMVHSIFLSQQPEKGRFEALLEEHNKKAANASHSATACCISIMCTALACRTCRASSLSAGSAAKAPRAI